MLFVFYNIDVLWLDNQKKIIQIKKNLKPFTLFQRCQQPAQYVIELPNGTINKTKTRVGDKIQF